jgi:hypothetical protein
MREESLETQLQQCLEAYDAGLTPEECLSAFPEERHLLEPLLRQALALRVTFAAAPREEFLRRARERLLFAAGREVQQAFDSPPDPGFVADARERFLFAAGREVKAAFDQQPDPDFVGEARGRFLERAGASAQEALRSVPPPRLPFWMNARRRLLEAASRQPAPRRQPVTALRLGMSFAAVVMAIAIAGMAYFATLSHPSGVSADLASLETDLRQVEELQASGQPVPNDVIVDLTRRTGQILQKLNEQASAAPAPVADKLPEIIARQKEIVNQAVAVSPAPPPELQEAQQNLNQAQAEVRILASRASEPPRLATATATAVTAAAAAPTETPPAAGAPAPVQPSPTAAPPTPTAPAQPTPTITAPQAGQVLITFLANDRTYGVSWKEVRTASASFRVPSDWNVIGLGVSASGLLSLDGNLIRIDSPDGGAIVVVNDRTGQVNAIVGGDAILLRGEGTSGKPIDLQDLVTNTGAYAAQLNYIVNSVELVSAASPTPAPSATPAASPTGTASPTKTATPSRTPTPTQTAAPGR